MDQNLIEQELKRSEFNGLRGKPFELYPDSKGYQTIGWGFCVDPRLGCKLPEPVAEFWLQYLIKQCSNEVISVTDWVEWFPSLDTNRQNVLVCLCYNMNLVKLQAFHSMIACLSEKDYVGAANELEDSKWYDDVGPDRGGRMVRILRTGVWE
jgi:GH24 family phage-related lysozyme (muramidase)